MLSITILTSCSKSSKQGSINDQLLHLLQNSQEVSIEQYLSYFITHEEVKEIVNNTNNGSFKTELEKLLEKSKRRYEGIHNLYRRAYRGYNDLTLFNIGKSQPVNWNQIEIISTPNTYSNLSENGIYSVTQELFDGEKKYEVYYELIKYNEKGYLSAIQGFNCLNRDCTNN